MEEGCGQWRRMHIPEGCAGEEQEGRESERAKEGAGEEEEMRGSETRGER